MRNEWCGFKVLVYDSLNEVDSSASALDRLCRSACAVKSRPLTVSEKSKRILFGNLPDEPEQSFGSRVLFGLQFVDHQRLEGLRFARSC